MAPLDALPVDVLTKCLAFVPFNEVHTTAKQVSRSIRSAARRALQRFYAPYAPHVRKLFTELATPGGGWEKAPWLSGRERE